MISNTLASVRKWIFITLALLGSAGASRAADIAIIGMNADTNKTFAFVALASIPGAEQIKFTDNGWTSGGTFRTGEGIMTWTAPVGGVAAGTVVTINTTAVTSTATIGTVTDTNDANFATSGDQILAYQGAEASPTFLFALNNEGAAVWQATAADSNTSALPTGLTNGTNALALSEVDNAAYSGITSGTAAVLRAAICTATNWTSNDTANVAFVTSFTITGGATITGAATATAFTTTYGSASTAQTFPITGTNLTADITATAPTGFEVSDDGITFGATETFAQSGGNASGTLHVRLAATAAVTGDYHAKNIVLSSTGATSVNITSAAAGNAVSPKALTITGVTAENKTYDASATATLAGTAAYDGLVNSETFSVAGTPVATFPSAAAGMGLTVTVTGYLAPSTNYSLTQPAPTANIDTAPLTITASDVTKILGATLTSGAGFTTFSSSGLVNPETIGSVTLTYGTGAAPGDAVGTYTDQVVPSLATGGTFTASNYAITYVPGDIIVSNTPFITLTGTLAEVDTVYGTPSAATSFTASGSALSGDLTVTPPAGYEVSLSAGSGYAATATLTAVSNAVAPTTVYARLAATTAVGTYSGNVTVSGGGAPSQTIATVASEASAKPITIAGITADNKPYDGLTTATLLGTAALVGVEPADIANVTLGGTVVAAFTSADKAEDIAVTVTGYTLSGTAAGNYSLTQPTGLVADITARELTLTGPTVTTKPYDATTAATITGTLTNVVGMDDVSLVGTGTFADPNVGTGIAVTSTATLSGTKAGNYSLTQPTGLAGNIIKATQIITFAALPLKLTTDAPFALTASSSSGLPLTYTSSVADVATVASGTVTIVGPGTTFITASQDGNSNYEPATSVVRAQAVVTPGGPVAIALVENGSYLQNFDSMGTTTGTTAPVNYPSGWIGYKVAGTGVVPPNIGNTIVNQAGTGGGTGTSGGIYNFGTTTDRALGSLGAGALTAAFGASFINLTGTTVEGGNLQLGFTAEQWRQNTTVANEVWIFEWKIGGNVNDSTGWNATSTFDINEILITASGAAAVDGNQPANRVVIPATAFSSLTGWEPGQLLHVRWRDTDDTGSDAAMAIDDFALTLTGLQPPAPKAYWDANGDVAGAGGPTPLGTWGTDLFWNSGSAGLNLPTAWTAGSDAVFSAGIDATGSYNVTVTGTQDVGAVFVEEGSPTLLGGTLNFSDLSPVVNLTTGTSLSIGSVISGSSGLLKQGGGSLELGGVNTFTGDIIIGSGSLSIAADSGLGAVTNDIIFGGGKLISTANITLDAGRSLSGSGLLAPAASTTLTVNSALATSVLNLADSGTLSLQGATNSLGNLVLSAAGSLSGNPVSLTDISATFTTGSSTVSNALNFGNTNRTIDVASVDSSLALTGDLTLTGGGNNRLIKTGAGTLSLSGVNTALNKVTLGLQAASPTFGGTISFSNKDALGITPIFFNYGTLFAAGDMTGANAIPVGISTTARTSSPAILDGGDMDFLGSFTFSVGTGTTGDIRIQVENHTTLLGSIEGNFNTTTLTGFAIGGAGRLTLSGSASTLNMPLRLTDTVTLEVDTAILGSATLISATAHNFGTGTRFAVGKLDTIQQLQLYGASNWNTGSVLHINIAGTDRGTEFDAIDFKPFAVGVAGAITFAGKIVVQLDPGFTPLDGQSFDILDWDAAITPDFTGIDFSELPALGGDLVWVTDDFTTSGVLRIRSTTPRTQFPPSGGQGAARFLDVTESSGTVNIEVILTNLPTLAPGQFITVPFTINAPPSTTNAATLNLDYTITTTPLRFGPGETSKNITVVVKPDTLPPAAGTGEARDESFIIRLLPPVAPAGVVVQPGSSTETSLTVTIEDDSRPPTAGTSPAGTLANQSSIVTAGTPVEYKFVPVGAAQLKLQWLRNGGATLGVAFNVTDGVEQTYSIASATLASAGKYSTKMSNHLLPAGVVSSTVAELVVVERLAEFATPRLTLGKEAAALPLVANAAGTGLVYRWQLNGANIPDTDTNYSGAGTRSLVIKAMSLAREGVYQCIISSTVPALAGDTVGATAYRVRQAATPVLDLGAVVNGVLPPASVGAQYQAPIGFQVPFIAGTEDRQSPSSWKQVGLPTGLSLSPTGVISGNPDVEIVIPTTYNVTISATNPAGTASALFTLQVNPVRPNAIGKFIALADRSGSFAANTGTLELGARIDFTTTVKGYLTGKVFVGTTSYSFPKTRINNNNPLAPTATALIKRKAPLTNLTVNLIIDATNDTVSGTIVDTATTIGLSGYRSVWNTKAVSLTKCATTVGSPTVTTVSTAKLATGMYVIGVGIPAGAKVDSIPSGGTTFVLSAPATATTLSTKPITLRADFGARHFEGLYNFGLDVPTSAPATTPKGVGYGSFKIATAGTLSIVGKTADGQSITGAAFVGKDGQVAIYRSLYATRQKGSILGTLDIDEGTFGLADNDINQSNSVLDWMRPQDPALTAREYKSGFVTALEAFGGSYLPPVGTNLILGHTGPGRARLVFAEGGIADRNNPSPALPAPNVGLAVDLLNKLLLDTGTTTTLKATASTGAFSGGFSLTDDNPRTIAPVLPLVVPRKTTFEGLMIREGSEVRGYGYFKLPKLPSNSPLTTPTTSEILSGMVVLEKL